MDVVVTVPMNFRYDGTPDKKGLAAWLAEGDPPGSEWSGERWWFTTYGACPDCKPGERVYVVCQGQLVGYAPLLECRATPNGIGRVVFVRGGDAVAVSIPTPITGFRGWRYRWWDRSEEIPIDLSKWIETETVDA